MYRKREYHTSRSSASSPSSEWHKRGKRKRAIGFGNNAYESGELHCCENDAKDVGKALGRLGFRRGFHLNKTGGGMKRIISNYASDIEPDDLIVFYFSGHGHQSGETNYIVGTDGSAVSIQWIINKIMTRKPYGLLMICDCCRTYSRRPMGAMTIKLRKNVVIGLSCQANASAREHRRTGNGYYTESLLKYLEKHYTVPEIMRRTRKRVYRKTRHHSNRQLPVFWDSNTHSYDFKLYTKAKNERRHKTKRNSAPPHYHRKHRRCESTDSSSSSSCCSSDESISSTTEGFYNLNIW